MNVFEKEKVKSRKNPHVPSSMHKAYPKSLEDAFERCYGWDHVFPENEDQFLEFHEPLPPKPTNNTNNYDEMWNDDVDPLLIKVAEEFEIREMCKRFFV